MNCDTHKAVNFYGILQSGEILHNNIGIVFPISGYRKCSILDIKFFDTLILEIQYSRYRFLDTLDIENVLH